MLTTAKIKIRDIKELQGDGDNNNLNDKDFLNKSTPLRKRKNQKKAATTSKKPKGTTAEECDTKSRNSDKAATETQKILPKTAKKFVELKQPSTQKRIHSYFTACAKTYQIKCETAGPKLDGGGGKVIDRNDNTNNNSKTKTIKNTGRRRGKRKRLFTDSKAEQTDDNTTISGLNTLEESQTEMPAVDCIIVIDDDDDEDEEQQNQIAAGSIRSEDKINNTIKGRSRSASTSSNLILESSKTSSKNATTKATSPPLLSTAGSSKTFSRRKLKPCPPYKIIEDTTFAVDAFQFGYIENVTHYFLTHFHADHYIGLTRSFAKPIYMSSITARFLRAFIPIDEQYINELELNETYTINDIEVTALDANHCPGAILLVFKLPKNQNSNNDDDDAEQKCILHTGDFRAWHGMESEPIFWNNNIHTIYLDTTYISDKYAFCSQYESLAKANELIENFQQKHPNQRILYICGSYVIGKEKFWSKLAEDYELKVWAEGNRSKALKALNDEQINRLLVEQATEANMHVIAMGKLHYLHLLEYFKDFEHMYDLVFAIRPSGWEKDTRPQYRGKINIVGIEYSEHSSYDEMKRFVRFLKPQKVLSTVPSGRDLMRTSEVPLSWYKYDKLKSSSNYQPTIAAYLGQNTQKKTIRPPNYEMDGMEKFVSPLKPREIPTNCEEEQETRATNELNKTSRSKTRNSNKLQAKHNENNNNGTAKGLTNNSSEDFERPEVQLGKRTSARHSKRQLQAKEEETNSEALKTPNKLEQKERKILRKSLKEIQTPTPESKEVSCKALAARQRSIKKPKSSPKTPTKKLIKNAGKLSVESDKKVKRKTNKKSLKNIKTDYLSSEEFESDNAVPTARKTETVTIDELPAMQTIYENSTSKGTPSCSSLQNPKTEETPMCDEIPISQRIYENSKSKANSSTSSQNLKDFEFENQLKNIAKQSGQSQTTDKPQHQLLITCRENPLFKSTSTSVASTSTEEIPPSQLGLNRILRNKFTKTAEEHSKEDFKNSRSSLDTNVVVKTLLHNGDALDRFSCTQLAGVVMTTLNEINPDVSKDHIPSDLLSSTDDDISVLNYKKPYNNMELRCSTLNERKRHCGSSLISKSLMALKKVKQTVENDNHETKLPSSSLNGLSRQLSTPLKKSKQPVTPAVINFNPENELPSCSSVSALKREPSLSPLAPNSMPLKKSKQPELLPITNDKSIADAGNFNPENELPSCSSFSALNRQSSLSPLAPTSTPLKKSVNTQALLKTILETKDDLHKFNCSQLAGLVVESINEHNPDYSRDHIPADLLSDADDDWM